MTEQNSKINKFLETYKNSIESQTSMNGFLKITIKAVAIADRTIYKLMHQQALELGAKAQGVSFLFPKEETKTIEKALGIPSDYAFLILREEDIEEGGPQPRLKIIDDPQIRGLAKSISEEGQKDPIDVYPSPLNNGKHRICEGHRRYTAIFGILKPQGKLDFILAKEKKRTELEAWQDSWMLNDKESLTDYEKGAFMLQLQQKFPETYSTQEAIAKKLGISQQHVSFLIKCYEEIERQSPKTNITTRVVMENIPEKTVREARKAPEELKPRIYQEIVDKKLSSRATKQLVAAVTSEEVPTEKTVAEKAAELFNDNDKFVQKSNRLVDKLVSELVPYYPEGLIVAVFGSFGGDDKVTVEKVRDLCQAVVDGWYRRALDGKTLDGDLVEAQKWK